MKTIAILLVAVLVSSFSFLALGASHSTQDAAPVVNVQQDAPMTVELPVTVVYATPVVITGHAAAVAKAPASTVKHWACTAPRENLVGGFNRDCMYL
jgi:hypothetical protein